MQVETEEHLFELSGSLDMPVAFADPDAPDCPLLHCNAAFEDLTGYVRDDVVGSNCRFLQGKDADPAAKQKLRQATMERRHCSVVLSNFRADGEQFNNFLFIEPITLAPGRQLLMGCQHKFRDFQSPDEILQGSQTLLSKHQMLRDYLIESKTILQEALTMRSETAVMMVKNYLLRQAVSRRQMSG